MMITAIVTTSRAFLAHRLRAHVCLFLGRDLTCCLFSDSPSSLREASSRLQAEYAAGELGTLVLEGVVRGIPRRLLHVLAGDLEAAACELEHELEGVSC